ncbi:hypothetical protein FHX76_002576 [Lysinibacter cavernae]|uniref:Uncharacterized protein n=1 Tax=Lysinibacter cavernae TaxID=1640652 RepID=A0A7X5R3H4_9MICO|nr:hypothetical protein [Lysinibacter cavernae]
MQREVSAVVSWGAFCLVGCSFSHPTSANAPRERTDALYRASTTCSAALRVLTPSLR